jgi:GNAT superfamily N-acetyltransferase
LVLDEHGASVWTLPMDAPTAAERLTWKHARLQDAMGDACLDCFKAIEASMEQEEAKLDLGGMWYLSILGVDPDMQGRRVGGGLLASVLEEADALGAASYLTTFTPRNIRFYERAGYRSAGNFAEPVTGSAFTVLVRPAGG